MAKVTINGTSYEGRTITVYENKIIVDGIDRTPDALKVNIQVEGDVDSLSVDVANTVTVSGVTKTLKTTTGNVQVNGNVTGGVQTTSGDVQVTGDALGGVRTVSGNVRARKILGQCSTVSGDIN